MVRAVHEGRVALTLAWLASFSTDTMLGNTGNLGMSGSGAMLTLLLFLLNSMSGSSAVVSGYSAPGPR